MSKKINTDLLLDTTKTALKLRGWSIEEIEEMEPSQIFSEFCEWNGLHQWANMLSMALDNARHADVRPDENF